MNGEHIGIRLILFVTCILVWSAPLLLPIAAIADPNVYFTPSLSIGRVYDDNLFFSTANVESDSIWRVSPALEAGLDSRQLVLAGYYSLDAERYARHPELDGNATRRHAALDFSYQPLKRLNLSMQGYYTDTNTPEQLAPSVGFQLGRINVRALSLNPGLSFAFNEVTSGTVDYALDRDELADGPDTEIRASTLGLKRRIGRADTLGANFYSDIYTFGNAVSTTSRAWTLGWAHTLSRRTSFSVAAGPRDTAGATAPEVAASLRHTLENGNISCSYVRSQTAVIGETEAVNVQSLIVQFDYSPDSRLDVLISPSYATDWGEGTKARIYGLNMNVSYKLNNTLSAIGSYEYGLQDGEIGNTTASKIRENVIYVGLVLSFQERTSSGFSKRENSPFETLWPTLGQ